LHPLIISSYIITGYFLWGKTLHISMYCDEPSTMASITCNIPL
jgi:hypothetical protein